jgi:hypothetical protein
LSFALVVCASVYGAPTARSTPTINNEAFNAAASLIAHGRFVADKKGAWRNDHPTRSQENDFMRGHGFPDYSKWYLALDGRHALNSKARYRFPFGDFRDVHRCGLLAVRARAHEYGYKEIEAAAAKLLAMIESAGPSAQKSADQFR